MQIWLSSELDAFVTQLVTSGRYATETDVIHAGLRLLMEREAEHEAKLEALRSDIRVAKEQVDHGEIVSAEEVRARRNARRARE